MEKGLVSIVSPCYNREKILWRFLDSILNQTYKKMQVILIDDGSTDGTLVVMKAYESRFSEAGILYEYYIKPNGGVSSAINEGLKYVKGEFLCWPDSDDWYEPEAMEKRVEFLRAHPEYGIVSCDAVCTSGEAEDNILRYVSGKTKERFESNQFWLMLKGKTMVCNICHMVRTEAFFATHPSKTIFDSRHGQNIQMLLPVYYHFKRGFIDEALCHYMIFENSLSRSSDTFEKKLAYRDSIEELTTATLREIQMPEKEQAKYIRFIATNNTRKRLILAKQYKKKKFAKKQLERLIDLRTVKIKDFIAYFQA